MTQTRERIEAICKAQWEMRGIDSASVVEMLNELRAHLDDAVADGKEPGDVVGPDVHAFAASWAAARQPAAQRWARLTLDFLSLLVLVLGIAHLRTWSTEVPVSAGLAVGTAVGIATLVIVELRRGDIGFWQGSILFFVAASVGLTLTELITSVGVLFTVPLWSTAPALLLVAVRVVRDMRRSAKAREAATESPPGDA